MLELFGRRYVIDHCLTELERESKEQSYRVYVTSTLRMIAESTSKYGGGSYPMQTWLDIIKPTPVDARTGNEIVADIVSKAGLTLIRGGEPHESI